MNPSLGLPLWVLSLALISVLVVSFVFGWIARLLLRGRAQLSTTASVVMSILGSAVGFALAWLIRPTVAPTSPLAISLALGASVIAVAAYASVAAHFQRPQRATTAELVRAGESDQVEFKSTARVNLHTGAKDDKMEQVVAKTLAAFLNADGGTLIVGVDDAGTPLGLDRDLATMKAPDHDRFQLWLRDLLTTALGPNGAALVTVEFEALPDGDGIARDVCRITAGASPRPVFLRPNKNAAPELWVRTGNSSRQLAVDAASEYVMHRWPLGPGAGIAAQFRAAMRFSQGR
ncbi:ATP-binding protein [Tessaracoccus sp.]|uniref:ATP-binding protein n=1 Tax=Tessaracoccus sp. TaxID=1971211 RepID=UPI00260B5957|nr:ATP-binding protein [Tessaracoccus sp.]